MRRVRDSSQYRSRIRRDDVMDGVHNTLGGEFVWPAEVTIDPALVTVAASTSKIEETPVTEAPDTLAIAPGLLTVAVSTSVA